MSLFDRPSAPPAHLPPRHGRFLRQIGAGARCWSLTGLKLLLGGDGLGADTSCLLSGSGWVVRWLIRRGYFAPAAGLPARRSFGVDSPCKARLSEPAPQPVESCELRATPFAEARPTHPVSISTGWSAHGPVLPWACHHTEPSAPVSATKSQHKRLPHGPGGSRAESWWRRAPPPAEGRPALDVAQNGKGGRRVSLPQLLPLASAA